MDYDDEELGASIVSGKVTLDSIWKLGLVLLLLGRRITPIGLNSHQPKVPRAQSIYSQFDFRR